MSDIKVQSNSFKYVLKQRKNMNMQLEKPMKQIVYLFIDSLSEKCVSEIESLIAKNDENREIEVSFDEDNKECRVETGRVEALEKTYQIMKTFLGRENITFSCLFIIDTKVDFSDGDAFEFMNGFLKDPYEGGQCRCMSTRFICRDEGFSEMLSLKISEDNVVNIEGTMLIDEDDGIINTYNKGISLLHKVIKY